MPSESAPTTSRRAAEHAPISPKQPPLSGDRDWYPYYAGFTEAFVEFVTDTELNGAQSVLDPWNGTGTTTAVCAKRGIWSVGIDINPALTVIARARLLGANEHQVLQQLTPKILAVAKQLACSPIKGDLLETWMRPDAASRIRRIQKAIHSLTIKSGPPSSPERIVSLVDQMSAVACFYYCVLFAVVRDRLRRYLSTNPMWLKSPVTPAHRLRPSWFTSSEAFIEHASTLSGRLASNPGGLGEKAKVMTGDATELSLGSDQFDAAVTSPPYATRIDYVRGTLPELAVLGADKTFLLRLRRTVTGTPVVKNVHEQDAAALESETARAVLDSIFRHSSKGSQSYYLPWLKNYFGGLQAGMSELARTVTSGGTICVVVQDSYYKECRVGLQEIVVELMGATGRSLRRRYDHPAFAFRRKTSQQSGRELTRGTSETLLVFR